MDCLGALEKFLHDDPVKTPTLIKAALAHVQFESIHPFLDGNGRVSRLLITLLLCAEGAMAEPLLYLSLYLKTNRETYYGLLQGMRDSGNWEEWLRFFLEGVLETAEEAARTTRTILKLFTDDRARVETIGRGAASALRVFGHLQSKPLLSIIKTAEELRLAAPTVATALQNLQELDIARELTGRQRGRLFVYGRYLNILNTGMEPIRRG